eukprot:TRINITY_DN31542_c0_g1_i1.p1 TRINITY_DN31542_c0_g1~~TRINITY_DN31542_c0_g1_i1.p1  ORF type:complete len:576 (-),score=160.60 TRINITY_DN31542_c0_g1_i1:352-1908(-)
MELPRLGFRSHPVCSSPRKKATASGLEDWNDLGHAVASPERLRVTKEIRKLKVMCISTPESGHLVPTVQVAVALAARQHRVQLVTCAWAEAKVAKICRQAGCEFVGVAPHVKSAECGEGTAAELKMKEMMISMFMYYDDEMCEPILELARREQPDVIVADFITPCAWHVADKLGITVVVNLPAPLSLLKMFSPVAKLAMTPQLLRMPAQEAAAMRRVFDEVAPLCHERACLVHSFFGLEPSTPVPPNVVVTGSTAPRVTGTREETSMPAFNTWLSWVREEQLKIVYVTMGSMQVLTQRQVEAIFRGLEKLSGVAVAWSLKEDEQALLPGGVENLPQRFFVNKWMPQAEALQLPEVALVISHCGWGGLNETICAGKPIVATPFRADQPVNAATAKKRGFCEIVKTEAMTAAAVETAVNKVLSDASYAQNAKLMQAALLKTGGAVACAEAVERFAEIGTAELVTKAPTLTELLLPKTRPLGYAFLGAFASWVAPTLLRAGLPVALRMLRTCRRGVGGIGI